MNYKEFQKAAIKKIVAGYESGEKNNRFLVADEVGLGKTIVAKGTIRCLFYFEYLKQNCPESFEYNVLYLCSNLNIAEQNKTKLGVSKQDRASLIEEVLIGSKSFEDYKGNHNEGGSSVENRTTMLLKKMLENISGDEKLHFQEIQVSELRKACVEIYGEEAIGEREREAGKVNPDKAVRLNIIPITTKTSIKIKGKGHRLEREFILKTLQDMNNIPEEKGNISAARQEVLKEFQKHLESIGKKYPEVLVNEESIQKLLREEEESLSEEEWEKLRQQFALASVEMLKYDFVIMDEFQNFGEILNKANETEARKKSYTEKAGYILEVLSLSDKNKAWIERIKEDYIVEGTEENYKLSEDEKVFWESELKDRDFEEITDIDTLIEQFTEIAERRIKWNPKHKNTQQGDKLKAETLKFVKNIILRKEPHEVNKDYISVSNDTSGFRWTGIEIIDLENDNEKYQKSATELFRERALKKNNLLSWWYSLSFETDYQEIRQCVNWGSIPKKQVPFRYLLNLHYATKGSQQDTYIPYLILNCFIYFCTDIKTKIYLWQYAYLLTHILAEGENRQNYSTEQLEPMRKMLGNYVMNRTKQDLDEQCENIVIEKIFNNEFRDGKYTRILMLSATPFRMYLSESNTEEDNANIIEVCDFLDTNAKTGLGNKLVNYKNQLLQFAQETGKYPEMISEGAKSDLDEVIEQKESFQKSMNQVFTRMERFAVLRELVEGWFQQQAEGKKEDELACGRIKELFEYVKQAREIQEKGSVISYAEDAPYMGTFMHGLKKGAKNDTQNAKGKKGKKNNSQTPNETKEDSNSKENNEIEGYMWKASFNAKVKEGKIPFDEDSYLYLTKSKFEQKKEPLGLWHGVFEGALGKMLDLDSIEDKQNHENHPGAARLLWVPSCVSVKNKKLKKSFAEHQDYGKTIIFSRLVQVPRMIAGLTGYEVLRRLSWMIEGNTDNSIFEKVLYSFGVEESGENSTYRKLDKLLDKITDKLEKKLLMKKDEDAKQNKDIREICREALGRYIHKYLEKQQAEQCETEYKQIPTCLEETGLEKLDRLADSLAKNFVHKVLLNRQQGMFAIWASEGFWDGKIEGREVEESDVTEVFLEDCRRKVLQYCEHGCLSDVLDEWLYICLEGEQDLGEFLGLKVETKNVNCLSFIDVTNLSVSLYENDGTGKVQNSLVKAGMPEQGEAEQSGEKIRTFYARCVGMSKDDDKVSSIKNLQQSFNAPFAPFVFATTSMGQEGLDFHHYADRIIHWRLPANPVDFEQREGRINRYHCLALRKRLIEWYGENGQADAYQVFQRAFKKATESLLSTEESVLENRKEEQIIENPVEHCGLVPDWVLLNPDKSESVSIKRVVPYFYLSKTNEDFHKNLKVLQLYRSVIGQNDPEEVMERLMTHRAPEEVAELFVDFSPYNTNDKPK